MMKKEGLPGLTDMLTMSDFNGNPMGYFFYSGASSDDSDVCSEVKVDAAICFDVYKVTPNDSGYDAFGVKDQIMRWIKNCRAPG